MIKVNKTDPQLIKNMAFYSFPLNPLVISYESDAKFLNPS